LLEQYKQLMSDANSDSCNPGGELELMVFSDMEKINIAIYDEIPEYDMPREDECLNDTPTVPLRLQLNRNKSCFVKPPPNDANPLQQNTAPTIILIQDRVTSTYKTVAPAYLSCASKHFLSDRRVIKQTMAELNGMKVDDLETLYTHVSSALRDRNGYVADFNVLLTALMGCNTNSLFLGSREQSKSAVFYIGKTHQHCLLTLNY